jgi:hypothetical protein
VDLAVFKKHVNHPFLDSSSSVRAPDEGWKSIHKWFEFIVICQGLDGPEDGSTVTLVSCRRMCDGIAVHHLDHGGDGFD